MNKFSAFMLSNESDDVKPNILLLKPPPSRPFHAVVAPGWARREVKPALDIQFPLAPYRQTPGPIKTSQTYLRTLVLERWDAEIRLCDESCRVQLSEHIQGPAAHQNLVQEMIKVRWNAEKKQCEESCKVQLLELLLAAHGITTLA
ncbi:uncharacterized protein F5891DRAFT_1193096 [Suillus fuscotomentosus]|uniref:Uncharacterized protein n=1 Tax=Suillus fuscotomentosus TaxID=1912939 RepID=A0AAD4HH87_9AGAM|nr:uncharacterized protein F5891DRAFT_1193096 [Suillus fuscotomentosus]KAG1896503.1 hypothetical protein F5891DRAFT_1193096 [Suillus fuscotomentosus]